MKKNLLKLLIPTLLIGLTACNGEKKNSSGGSELPDSKDVTILCYIDYNHADESNPYHRSEWYYDYPFSKEDIELVDPSSSQTKYEEFGTFKGWSTHPIINSDDQLFNFGVDVVEMNFEKPFPYLILYGIWVSE